MIGFRTNSLPTAPACCRTDQAPQRQVEADPESGTSSGECLAGLQVERIINKQLSHWEKHGFGWWAVELPETKTMIGWCGLQFLPETNETEVAYMLEMEQWGQGFGTEVARYSLRYGFIDLGIEKIVAIVHPNNLASRKVIKKLGMHFVDRASYFGMDCFRFDLDAPSFEE